MPTQRKIFTVANLTEKFKQVKGLVLSDYRGLKVDQINDLRAKVKKAGGELEVVKNTLLNLAAKNAGISLDKKVLKKPTAVLWLYEEKISPLKAFFQFIKTTETPKVKYGLLDGLEIPLEQLKELANLPPKEILQAKLVNIIQSPIRGLIHALNWNQKKLLLVLKAIEGGEKNG